MGNGVRRRPLPSASALVAGSRARGPPHRCGRPWIGRTERRERAGELTIQHSVVANAADERQRGGLVSESRTFAVVGAGLAGGKAVEALRGEGFDGRLVLFGAEPHRPYERPPLSKDYLLGKAERDVVFVHPADWYTEHDVELRLGTPVVGLDRHAHELITGHDPLHYDKLLLATGASPRRLQVPGADLAGVRYLRNLEDSEALK